MTKANTLGSLPGSLAAVAFSGNYSDLANKPASLVSLEALTGTAGFLKKTGASTWSLDTNTYLTAITTGLVTGALGFTPESSSNKGLANGYAPLGSDSKIASSYLPSYVDDVLEYSTFADLPATGETAKIYVLSTPYTAGGITSSQYRWSGSAYAAIIASPGSTDAVTEGSVNLYFTNTRALSATSAAYLPISGGTLTGAVSGTALTLSGLLTLSGGTANGVPYLNASKQIVTGAALTFDGNTFAVNSAAGAGINIGYSNTSVNYYDANTQIFRDGTFAEYMRLTSTGLGIGTSSPGYKLDVNGTFGVSGNVTLSGGTANGVPYLNASKEITSGSALQFDGTSFSLGRGYSSIVRAYIRSVGSTSGTYGLVVENSTPSTTFAVRDDGRIDFGIGTKAVLDENGNLGLGVTTNTWSSTNKALQISNGAVFGGLGGGYTVVGQNYYGASGADKYIATGPASRLYLYQNTFAWQQAVSGAADTGITWTTPMTLNASGDWSLGLDSATYGGVGITTAEIFGSSTARLLLGSTAGSTTKYGIYASGGTFGIYDYIANTTRFSVDASGNVLIGRTDYLAAGTGRISMQYDGSSTWGAAFQESAGVATAYPMVFINSAGTVVGSISHTSTATSYNVSSDYRLKNITGPLTNSGAYIDSLNPVEGTWKADGSIFVGLLAHEAQDSSRTQVATGVKDGDMMQAMDYSSPEIIANLIAELQAVRLRLAVLESSTIH